MKNAHERFGWLEFEKQLRDTRTKIRVGLDRFIGEPSNSKGVSEVCHLVSVFGNDVDIGAVWAAIAAQERLTVCGPGLSERRVSLGKDPRTYHGTMPLDGRRRSVRHLVALSAPISDDTDVGRIVLSQRNPEFVLYRISHRLGLPVHPTWASWFWSVLVQERRIQPLDGLGYRPLAVAGTRDEFLEWIGTAVKEKKIEIPEEGNSVQWNSLPSNSLD